MAVQNRREWPFMALSIANVDCSEFDAEIATTASRGKRNRLTRRQDRFGVHLAVWPAIAFLITPDNACDDGACYAAADGLAFLNT